MTKPLFGADESEQRTGSAMSYPKQPGLKHLNPLCSNLFPSALAGAATMSKVLYCSFKLE